MITITVTNTSIHVHGHAGAAPPGQDIICAAVSTLTQNLVRSIESLTDDKIEYSISPGMVDIDHGELSKESRTLVDSFFIGVCAVANQYPEYVRIQ